MIEASEELVAEVWQECYERECAAVMSVLT
jgi:hypothetical protein